MTADRVSVLLPFRDAERTLREALESVLAERGVDLEVICVDDGSRDAGPRIAEQIARRDARVRLARGGGRGLVAALELARSRASGRWLARMDADDVSVPGRMDKQLRALRASPRLAALGTWVEPFPSHAVGEGLRHYVRWQNGLVTPPQHARDLFVEAPLCHPSVMLRREAVEEVGGFREVPWAEDYDLWLRLDAAGWGLAKLPEVLLRWRHRPGRATFADPRYALARFREAKATFLAPKLRARGRPIAIWGAGPTGKRLARELERHAVTATLFVDIDPRKIGRTARGAPIVEPRALVRGEHTVVVAVGARGARREVRGELTRAGFEEGDDFICAA